MNINFLKELRENRLFLLALLIGLFLIVFIWVAIALLFRSEPEELVGPFYTSTAVPPTATVSVSDALQAAFTPTVTGTVTPIVLSTFTPRTGVPLMTATSRERPLPTLTLRPTNTRRPPPTFTPRLPTRPPAPTVTDKPPYP